MPDFQDFTQTRSKEFVEEIVGIFRPIRKGYYQYEHLQVYPLERLTEQTIRAHEIVVTMYSEAATGEFIFKYFPHNDKCASSEMIDIKPKPTRMTDAEMDEDGNVVLLTISPAVLKRYVDMNEPVLLCKARVWTTSAASDAGVKRHRERHEEYINGGMAKEFKEINEAMGLGKKRKIST